MSKDAASKAAKFDVKKIIVEESGKLVSHISSSTDGSKSAPGKTKDRATSADKG